MGDSNANYPPIYDPQELKGELVARENAGDVAGMVALFERDTVIDLGDERVIRGTDALRDYFVELQQTGIGSEGRRFQLGKQRPALIAGDLALTFTHCIDGDITSEVARRQVDGT